MDAEEADLLEAQRPGHPIGTRLGQIEDLIWGQEDVRRRCHGLLLKLSKWKGWDGAKTSRSCCARCKLVDPAAELFNHPSRVDDLGLDGELREYESLLQPMRDPNYIPDGIMCLSPQSTLFMTDCANLQRFEAAGRMQRWYQRG